MRHTTQISGGVSTKGGLGRLGVQPARWVLIQDRGALSGSLLSAGILPTSPHTCTHKEP